MEEEMKKGKVVSPDQLDTYLQVAGGSSLFIFLAVSLLTAGFLIWAIFGRVRVTIPVNMVSKDDWEVAYVHPDEEKKIKAGMKVITDEQEGAVAHVSEKVENVNGSLLYPVYITFPQGKDLNVTTGKIVVKEITPISYLFSS